MPKNKFYSNCCNAEVYYRKGSYYCGKCNRSVILVFPEVKEDIEMPKPKRID